jgi:hypothetical protein
VFGIDQKELIEKIKERFESVAKDPKCPGSVLL